MATLFARGALAVERGRAPTGVRSLILSAIVTFPSEAIAATTVTPRRRNRHLPAFLDAIFPGLGHLV
ncbi:MAG: hypothetical protein ACJ77C_06320, partial [Chloroflexota bacterium]